MSELQFPCTIFKTQRWMDDYGADDMHCGDLTEAQLKTQFNLFDVSNRANPYTLTKIAPFNQSQSTFYDSREEGQKITRQQCANILFDELRHLSQIFAVYSPYQHIIGEMLTHMQNCKGSDFFSLKLNAALKEQITNDRTENSTRLLLKEALNKNIDWRKKYFPIKNRDELRKAILFGKLPKFDRVQDNLNGMGITVHDTWATHITIKSLQIDEDSYRAVVHYKVQDHFGLDNGDISKFKFNSFRFFRIWFLLQRYDQFGFNPFMTNIETTMEIIGGVNDGQK